MLKWEVLGEGRGVRVKGYGILRGPTTFAISLIPFRRDVDVQERGGVTDEAPRDQGIALCD